MSTFENVLFGQSDDEPRRRLSDPCPDVAIPEWLLDLADERGFRLGNAVTQHSDGTVTVRWFAWDAGWNTPVADADSWTSIGEVRDYILEHSG